MDTVGWHQFVAVCRPQFASCEFKAELISACAGLDDIACVTYYHLGDRSLAWLQSSVPALDGKAPFDLLRQGAGDAVRTCLWQMP
jgi:Protein of unknown function (DUF2384)